MRLTVIACVLVLSACARPTLADRLRGDEPTADAAIRQYAERGEGALPELRTLAADSDPLVRRRARTAIGRITGQWGSETGLLWKRRLADAKDQGRPVAVLHLFGEFDKEFC